MHKKIHILSFSLALGTVGFILAAIFSIWSRFTGFAQEFWQIYISLHPTPFGIKMLNPTPIKHFAGILIDAFYALLDGIILGSGIAFFYNFFLKKITSRTSSSEPKTPPEEPGS